MSNADQIARIIGTAAELQERERRMTLWPSDRKDHHVFEASATETIGGYLPQVRYRHDSRRSFVVWQGTLVEYTEADAHDQAMQTAERKIAEAIITLFGADLPGKDALPPGAGTIPAAHVDAAD